MGYWLSRELLYYIGDCVHVTSICLLTIEAFNVCHVRACIQITALSSLVNIGLLETLSKA